MCLHVLQVEGCFNKKREVRCGGRECARLCLLCQGKDINGC